MGGGGAPASLSTPGEGRARFIASDGPDTRYVSRPCVLCMFPRRQRAACEREIVWVGSRQQPVGCQSAVTNVIIETIHYSDVNDNKTSAR